MPYPKKLNTFKYVDAAQQFSDNPAIVQAANQEWTDLDYLVQYILDYIPKKYRNDYLEIVTNPNF